MNRQREVIYGERRAVLEGADLHDQIRTMIDEVVEAYVTAATEGFPEEWDLEALWTALKHALPGLAALTRTSRTRPAAATGSTASTLIEDLKADAQAAYDAREAEVGEEVMRELERRVLLSVLDRKWREHLYEMDYLREGIGLRAYSQRDPLVEYQREGFDMFNAMKEGIREETVGFLFNLEVQVEPRSRDRGHRHAHTLDGAGRRGRPGPGPGRGDPAAQHERPPADLGQGARGAEAAAEPHLLRALEDGEAPRSGGSLGRATDDPYAGAEPQRRVPLRLGQEVQEVPRRPGRADRPDHAGQRLTGSRARAELTLSRTAGPCRSSGRRDARSGRRSRGSGGRGGRAR